MMLHLVNTDRPPDQAVISLFNGDGYGLKVSAAQAALLERRGLIVATARGLDVPRYRLTAAGESVFGVV